MTNSLPTVRQLIELYSLVPHPEGGYFNETYRATGTTGSLPAPFRGARSHSTAIYFLLPQGNRSRLHRIASDELWHFYLGGPMRIVELSPTGGLKETILGSGVLTGQRVQHVVQAGTWFGGFPEPGTEYSFVGCTVAPGFDFADFEMGRRQALVREFPRYQALIERLTDA